MTLPDHLGNDDAGQVIRVHGVLLDRHTGSSYDDAVSTLLALRGILSVDVVDREHLTLLSHPSMDPAPPPWTALVTEHLALD